jgi:hexosaminidase
VCATAGRHYLSIPRIRKTIDGLAMFRLNVLHWHITDSTSFPVKTDRHPELAAGAFAAGATYNTSELKDLVSYAKNRGVRIVPGMHRFSRETAATATVPSLVLLRLSVS